MGTFCMPNESIKALAHALLDELKRKERDPRHVLLQVSWTCRCLPNGIKCCSVQLRCAAGCGWLIDSYGHEAGLLETKAVAIHTLLEHTPMSFMKSPHEILEVYFSEIAIESRDKFVSR